MVYTGPRPFGQDINEVLPTRRPQRYRLLSGAGGYERMLFNYELIATSANCSAYYDIGLPVLVSFLQRQVGLSQLTRGLVTKLGRNASEIIPV